jgi:hypothetical protein
MHTFKAGVAMAVIGGLLLAPLNAAGRQDAGPGVLAGTAKNEAKKPYTDFTTRARNVADGTIAATVPLDAQGNFSMKGLGTTNYLVELVNKSGKVVCTEGPYLLTDAAPQKNDVDIKCGVPPAAWLLLGAAAAAGVTVGVVQDDGPASASQ